MQIRKLFDPSGIEIGWEHSTPFPAGDADYCGSAIIISHGVCITEPFRGKGHGTRLHLERLERFRVEGYNYALCTVRRENVPQMHILNKQGWNRLANTASFDGTPLYIMGRSLK